MACDRCGGTWATVLYSFGGAVIFCPECGYIEIVDDPQDEDGRERSFSEAVKGEGDELQKS